MGGRGRDVFALEDLNADASSLGPWYDSPHGEEPGSRVATENVRLRSHLAGGDPVRLRPFTETLSPGSPRADTPEAWVASATQWLSSRIQRTRISRPCGVSRAYLWMFTRVPPKL